MKEHKKPILLIRESVNPFID